jgi:hypothetical protein
MRPLDTRIRSTVSTPSSNGRPFSLSGAFRRATSSATTSNRCAS